MDEEHDGRSPPPPLVRVASLIRSVLTPPYVTAYSGRSDRSRFHPVQRPRRTLTPPEEPDRDRGPCDPSATATPAGPYTIAPTCPTPRPQPEPSQAAPARTVCPGPAGSRPDQPGRPTNHPSPAPQARRGQELPCGVRAEPLTESMHQAPRRPRSPVRDRVRSPGPLPSRARRGRRRLSAPVRCSMTWRAATVSPALGRRSRANPDPAR